MKRFFAVLLAALLLCGLTACQKGSDADTELEAMRMQIQLLQQQLDDAKKAEAAAKAAASAPETVPMATVPPVVSEPVVSERLLAVNCTVDGQTELPLAGAGDYTATAVVPEGMAVAGWLVNGVPAEDGAELDVFSRPVPVAGETHAFHTDGGTTVVTALLRDGKTVKTVNAEMQFLDAKGKAKGDAFTEFAFERDYENPVTKTTVPGGTITVSVSAVVPKGYAVDYWKINGVPHDFNRTVASFTATQLDASAVYEAVLKKESAAPTATYTVTCKNCTFSGGGYSGATSGKVPAGTVITVTPSSSASGGWGSSWNQWDYPVVAPTPITRTINSNSTFVWQSAVN